MTNESDGQDSICLAEFRKRLPELSIVELEYMLKIIQTEPMIKYYGVSRAKIYQKIVYGRIVSRTNGWVGISLKQFEEIKKDLKNVMEVMEKDGIDVNRAHYWQIPVSIGRCEAIIDNLSRCEIAKHPEHYVP